ncbi:MAG: DUF4832 domain-containing protein [Paludibacteraceae bacterium]|nr:DUF4832 domain-containing protein [Paludibacteraceae bacterium]
MKKISAYILALTIGVLSSCDPKEPEDPQTGVIIPVPTKVTVVGDSIHAPHMQRVAVHSSLTHAQPMTGLVLWPDQAADLDSTYGDAISMEFAYCLPCRIVQGKSGEILRYDWEYLNDILDDIASRNHQAILRFRYEYPGSREVNPDDPGATAVPEYIKEMEDYHEQFNNVHEDGPTYYADWSHPELQWFTKQFFQEFALRYNYDPRIAFVEIGFGHWSEYHIYGTELNLGVNFPSKEYQKEFFEELATYMHLPWSVSIDAADEEYSPFTKTPSMMNLAFGLFDDSFMHEEHEIGSGDGYNEQCWNAIGKGTRWKKGPCGGEISYYEESDQHNFLNPAGMYGHTWEEQAAKYHISFMIANDAPEGQYGTAARFKQASLASGYHFKVLDVVTDADSTLILVTNTGVAPIYTEAFFSIGYIGSSDYLNQLMPGDTLLAMVYAPLLPGKKLEIYAPYILDDQVIEFEANVNP